MTSGEAPVPDGGSTASAAGPPAFDTSVASQARMYDYLLGGKDNYAADREADEQALMVWPDMPFTARANRAFLGRAVGYFAREAGVRQFLDIGTGIPTAGNTHQVAQAIAPESRVVYVDYDPIVLAHARALLTSNEDGATDYIDADLRDTGVILARASQLLDFTQPVAVTLIAILNAIPDSDDPHGIVATLMDAVPSGSYLALTHLASDLLGQDAQDGLEDVNAQKMRMRFTSRDREQVARFFEGTELVEPGLVRVEDRAGRAGPGRHRPRQGQPGLRAADRARHRDRPAGPAGRGGVTDGGRGADAGTRRSRSPARPGTVAGLEAASFGAFLDVRLARPAQASR